MKVLRRTQFGDPILRQKARDVPAERINTKEIQRLIADMRHTLISKKLGIGLAAPQVGRDLALAVVAVRATELRPHVRTFDLVMVNPKITDHLGRKTDMWEGCISSGADKAGLFAKVPRYEKVKARYYDETGKLQQRTFKDLHAQVVQHEVDHLNGILFVDKVVDTKSYMTYGEYMKRAKKQASPKT